MPSTYSTNLKIELQTTGENSGSWGTITNTNLGTALEQAIVGYGNPDFATDANLTLTYTNTNAAQAARALVLNVTSTGSLTATRELVVPTIQKQYIVQNNTTGSQSITVKTSAGTGIAVPNGRKAHLYVDGTNVVQMFDFVDINGGTIDGATVGASSASTGAFTTLSASSTTTLSGLTASTALALDASKNVTSVTNTGTGNNVLATSPTLVTPVLGTPSSGTLTSCTGLPLSTGVTGTLPVSNGGTGITSFGSGVATWLGTPSSANLASAVTDETGTGALVFATSPTLVTPTLGAATATSVNKVAITAPATSATLTVANGKTLTANNSITLAGTDATTMTFPSTSASVARTDAAQTFTGTQTFSSDPVLSGGTANGVLYLNGSKVATSGSALTFDGNNLKVGYSLTGILDYGVSSGVLSASSYLTAHQTSKGIFQFQSDVTTIRSYGATAGSGQITFNVGGGGGSADSEAMRLTSTGLGIGTSSPAYKLDVVGPVQSSAGYYINGNTGGGYIWVRDNYALRFGTNDTERARITSGGDLAVGRTSAIGGARVSAETSTGNPTYAAYLPTTGTETAFLLVNPNGTVGSITTNGSATAYNTSSDYRLKNITGPITNSGAYIDSLNPVEGTWKADGSIFVGLIAHEVQEVSRTIVATGEKDGEEMQGIDYSSAEIIANLIAEVKSLRTRIAALEAA